MGKKCRIPSAQYFAFFQTDKQLQYFLTTPGGVYYTIQKYTMTIQKILKGHQ